VSHTVTDPTTREEIEAVIKAKIESGDAEPGLYDVGISYVVVNDIFGCGITFQWFGNVISFSDLLND